MSKMPRKSMGIMKMPHGKMKRCILPIGFFPLLSMFIESLSSRLNIIRLFNDFDYYFPRTTGYIQSLSASNDAANKLHSHFLIK